MKYGASLLFFFTFSLSCFLWPEELTTAQKNNMGKAVKQLEQAEKATNIGTLEAKLKLAKPYLDLLENVAQHEEVQKVMARYAAQERRLKYEKEAGQLKPALGKAQAQLKRYPDSKKLPGYEKKNIESYLKQIQASMPILREAPEGQYADLLKQAEATEKGLMNLLEPAADTKTTPADTKTAPADTKTTTDGPPKLSPLVQGRLNKINTALTNIEQLLEEAEKKLQSGSAPPNMERVRPKLQGLLVDLDAFRRQIEITKVDENHPTVAAILKRMEEIKQRITTLGDAMEKLATKAAQEEAAGKELKKAQAQTWIDKLKVYAGLGGEKVEKDLDPYSRPVSREDAPEKIQSSLKLKLQQYQEAQALFAEYQQVQFAQGKTSELEQYEERLATLLKDFKTNYLKYLDEPYQEESQKLEQHLTHLKKNFQEAEKDPKKQPYVYPVRELVEHRHALQFLKTMAATVKEVAPELHANFSTQVDSLSPSLQELEAANLENLKIRASRTLMEADRYQGNDSEALKKKAQELLYEHYEKCAYKPHQPKVLKIHLFYKDWDYREQWVDGKYRTWREMKVLIAVRPEGEPLWIWGGTAGGYDTKNSGEYQGVRLEGDYVYLSCIYLEQDKIGGEWRSTKGNYIWTDPMASVNVK